ncbi:peptidase, A24 family [Aliarcobacter cibarius]|uniref:prepilin peptidase n=1 Tax=Aliarcobacter cibarius TaxID=255507 RepID=UPI0012A0BDBA|nr:prepilin peptidase [Aliarcobacter cibarius]QEZ88325.1 peptidase, A24 family [Aliarcobacter cibarius]
MEFDIVWAVALVVYIINLLALSFYDLKFRAVPDYLLLIALITSFFVTKFDFFEALKNAFICTGAIVLLNFIVTFYIQNIKARILKDETLRTQTALGEGDIPIIATLGIILGLESTLIAILLSAIIAIIQSIYLKFVKKENEIPFIPSLVFGFFIEYFFSVSTMIKDFY